MFQAFVGLVLNGVERYSTEDREFENTGTTHDRLIDIDYE